MKTIITGLLVATFAVNGMAQFNTSNKTLFERKTFPLSSVKNMELTTSGGSIYAEGVNSGEAILEVYVSGNNGKSISLEEAQKRIAENYQYESGLNGSTLFARVKNNKSFFNNNNSVNISYKVIIPVQTSSEINTSGGSIQVLNLKGSEKLNTSGGSLTINNIEGQLNAATSGGSIVLKQSSGALNVVTSGGSLHLDDLKGTIKATTSGGSIEGQSIAGSLNVATSGGSIKLTDIAATTDATTSGGSVSASFNDPGKGIKLATAGGGIQVSVPKDKGYDLDLRGDRVSVSNATLQGSVTKTKIDGKTNGGGIPLKASTSSGSVTVTMN